MNSIKFMNEYSCQWTNDDKHNHAFNLWIKYHFFTEVYDQGICSARSERDGTAIPTNSWEYNLINRNARMLYKEILKEARDLGIDDDTWRATKMETARFTPAELERLYKNPIKG